jgi:hypothetical protein
MQRIRWEAAAALLFAAATATSAWLSLHLQLLAVLLAALLAVLLVVLLVVPPALESQPCDEPCGPFPLLCGSGLASFGTYEQARVWLLWCR